MIITVIIATIIVSNLRIFDHGFVKNHIFYWFFVYSAGRKDGIIKFGIDADEYSMTVPDESAQKQRFL